MKKVNWGVLAAVAALCAFLAWMTVRLFNQLVGLGEMNENLMGRMYNTPDEY